MTVSQPWKYCVLKVYFWTQAWRLILRRKTVSEPQKNLASKENILTQAWWADSSSDKWISELSESGLAEINSRELGSHFKVSFKERLRCPVKGIKLWTQSTLLRWLYKYMLDGPERDNFHLSLIMTAITYANYKLYSYSRFVMLFAALLPNSFPSTETHRLRIPGWHQPAPTASASLLIRSGWPMCMTATTATIKCQFHVDV